jgi:hypothetical protein
VNAVLPGKREFTGRRHPVPVLHRIFEALDESLLFDTEVSRWVSSVESVQWPSALSSLGDIAANTSADRLQAMNAPKIILLINAFMLFV